MKKRYRLHFVKTECYSAVVEADSLQEAIDMADDVESGQMEAIDDTLCYEFDKVYNEFHEKLESKNKGKVIYIDKQVLGVIG